MKKNSSQIGQTLIEVLIALGTATVIIAAIVIIVMSSLTNVQFSKNQNVATQYAQEGIEIIRKLAQSNWADFSTYDNTYYCLDKNRDLTQKGISCGTNIDNLFVREIDISQKSMDCSSTGALITALVSWSDTKCTSVSNPFCHQIKIVSCVNNNSSVTAP